MKQFSIYLLLAMLPLSAMAQLSALSIYDLRCENLSNPLGIDNPCPHFSWKLDAPKKSKDKYQTAYEIQISSDSINLVKGKADVWTSGKVNSRQQVMVPYGGQELHAHNLCYWRVRSFDDEGLPTEWSSIARFSIGLDENTLNGQYILQPASLGNQEAPVFSKTIKIKNPTATTFLHVNSIGYHEVLVNGQHVSDIVLAPAVSQLNKRSAIVTYDITPALKKGENTIEIALGQGWYKKATFEAEHPGPMVKAEIDIYKGKKIEVVASTDATWTVRRTGYSGIGTWGPLQFGGERFEAPDGRTAQAEVVKVEGMKATPQMFAGNRIINRMRPVYGRMTKDGWVADLGRNITGWWQMTFHNLKKGQEVKIEYTDDLKDGEFHVMDGLFEMDGKGEYDIYIAKGEGDETFSNRFHNHAYRYVRVSGLDYEPSCDDCKGLQITGTNDSPTEFSCSDADITAIHDMVQRTLRCLTHSGYSVDCPHLERLGYGGDGNSSTMTIQTMFDAAPTYYNWIQAWADAQDPDGGMPHVAPAGGGGGGPYWCGFIVRAPYRAYLNYADDRMLVKHYDNMAHWLEYVKQYSPNGLLTRWPDTKTRAWFLGDWLAPMGVDAGNEKSVMHVSNCFVVECLESMSTIAAHLGKTADAEKYLQWKKELQQTIHATFYNPEDSTYAVGSPLDLSYAMITGVVPQEEYAKVKAKLEILSRTKYNTHIAVGLVGIAIFTEWATRNNEANLMYDILKQPDYPGYMDMINHDATTTWESWDRSRSRIHNCYNGIGTWFYQALGGIIPDIDHPGYEHFTVAPQYPDALQWVRVKKECPYGSITVDWRRMEGRTQLNVTVPVGTTATIHTPEGVKEVGSGFHHFLF